MSASKTDQPTLTPSWNLLPHNYQLVKRYLEPLIVVGLLPTAVLTLGNILAEHHRTPLALTLSAVGGLWSLLNLAASVYLQLSSAKGKELTVADCYQKSWRYYWRLLGFIILFGLMLLGGFLLLIVPGLIVLRRYLLTPLYIVDKDLPIREAMRKSAAQSKPVAGYIWGVVGVELALSFAAGIIGGVFNFIPGLAPILSILAALSFYFLVALRYREVTKVKSAKID